jgi:hypothetical protein
MGFKDYLIFAKDFMSLQDIHNKYTPKKKSQSKLRRLNRQRSIK